MALCRAHARSGLRYSRVQGCQSGQGLLVKELKPERRGWSMIWPADLLPSGPLFPPRRMRVQIRRSRGPCPVLLTSVLETCSMSHYRFRLWLRRLVKAQPLPVVMGGGKVLSSLNDLQSPQRHCRPTLPVTRAVTSSQATLGSPVTAGLEAAGW